MGEIPADLGVENVLRVVSDNQQRLEKSFETFQQVILEQLKSLQQAHKTNADYFFATPETPTLSLPMGKHESAQSTTTNGPLKKRQSDIRQANRISKLSAGMDVPPTRSWRNMSFEEKRRLRNSKELLEAWDASMEMPRAVEKNTSTDPSRAFQSAINKVEVFNPKKKKSLRATMHHTLVGSLDKREPLIVNVVRHPVFHFICGSMVIVNSVLVGLSVEVDAVYEDEAKLAEVIENLSLGCSCFFILELVLRVSGLGIFEFFLFAEDRLMNLFDALLVSMSILDICLSIANTGQRSGFDMGQTFKTMRLLRILRIFRLFRFFHELSLMVLMICECMASLFWAIVLLVIIMYTFAVIFTQSAAIYTKKQQHNPVVDLALIEAMFGSVPRTCYVLYQAILGGLNWGYVSDTMLEIDKWSAVLFFGYIAFTLLAVLNIITGIFVDNALETSRLQREFIIKREEKAKAKIMKELSKLFDEMDEDADGKITWYEMSTALEDPKVEKYFSALGLLCDDMHQLFTMMDDDQSGEVDMEEFLDGCQRCTGDAKGIDIQAILHEVKRLHKRFDMKKLSKELRTSFVYGKTESVMSRLERRAAYEKTQTNESVASHAGAGNLLEEIKQLKKVNELMLLSIDRSRNEAVMTPGKERVLV